MEFLKKMLYLAVIFEAGVLCGLIWKGEDHQVVVFFCASITIGFYILATLDTEKRLRRESLVTLCMERGDEILEVEPMIEENLQPEQMVSKEIKVGSELNKENRQLGEADPTAGRGEIEEKTGGADQTSCRSEEYYEGITPVTSQPNGPTLKRYPNFVDKLGVDVSDMEEVKFILEQEEKRLQEMAQCYVTSGYERSKPVNPVEVGEGEFVLLQASEYFKNYDNLQSEIMKDTGNMTDSTARQSEKDEVVTNAASEGELKESNLELSAELGDTLSLEDGSTEEIEAPIIGEWKTSKVKGFLENKKNQLSTVDPAFEWFHGDMKVEELATLVKEEMQRTAKLAKYLEADDKIEDEEVATLRKEVMQKLAEMAKFLEAKEHKIQEQQRENPEITSVKGIPKIYEKLRDIEHAILEAAKILTSMRGDETKIINMDVVEPIGEDA